MASKKSARGVSSSYSNSSSVKFTESSTQAVIRAAYLQVFGRDVFDGQRQKVAEIKLENGDIPMREFIRMLAKSDVFRNMYWSKLYVCKAIEYIHRRLLGRPTYCRQEMNAYFEFVPRRVSTRWLIASSTVWSTTKLLGKIQYPTSAM